MNGACDACLRRAWLVAELAGAIQLAADRRDNRLRQVLALPDEHLIAALGGARRAEFLRGHAAFDADVARETCLDASVATICRHDARYPPHVLGTADAPAVLHVAGAVDRFVALTRAQGVAVVGARRASAYGLEMARDLGRGLAVSGVTVVSGMALGADSAAHEGALDVDGPTLAVLAGGADHCYPSSKRRLYRQLVERRCTVSEMPPGFRPFRWCFPARNRIIAGLAVVTVVVEAAARSGSLITAEMAQELGRQVGAVPGRATSPLAAGANQLLADGAQVVRGARDVLDLVFGAGGGSPEEPRDDLAGLAPRLRGVLDAVAEGSDSLDMLAPTPADAGETLVALAELEMLGLLRRGPAGRYALSRAAAPSAVPMLGGDA